jgi:hypothetical protein
VTDLVTDLVILTGSPGSGKTTVDGLVARRHPRSVHLHTDDFWHFIARSAVLPSLPGADCWVNGPAARLPRGGAIDLAHVESLYTDNGLWESVFGS